MRLVVTNLDRALEIADLMDEYSAVAATVDEAFVVDCPELSPEGRVAVRDFLDCRSQTTTIEPGATELWEVVKPNEAEK